MLNVGGGGPRQGPMVRGLTIAFNKCPPLLGRNQWLPMLSMGTKSEMAQMWAEWLPDPYPRVDTP